jgi:probable H4MPT-linked C1 transfer pathway protein
MSHRGVIGWDIGGVNTKVARVENGVVGSALSHPYEIQHDPAALAPLLRTLAGRVGAAGDDRHAVTMTAELSQMFRTKREGVAFVLDALAAAFPTSDVRVYAVDGRFLSADDAVAEPLAIAASNWAATGAVVARDYADAILIDIGTTTTDIIPIVNGRVAAVGATDPARLASGELVYTGALRTPVEAITHRVPLGDATAGVSAESFALIGDIHVWRGDLATSDYSVATPDRRPPSREFAGERIARVVCADREMLDDRALSIIADAVADAQVQLIGNAIRQVRHRCPTTRTAVVTGLGAFIAERAARLAGLEVARLADTIGADGSVSAPAAAVALLLEQPRAARRENRTRRSVPNARPALVHTVYKVGGSLLADAGRLDAALDSIIDAARESRVAIVPGGGPFADTIRDADRRLGLADDTAHWMAIMAMDQYAYLLAGRRDELAVAFTVGDIDALLAAGRVPVIAPHRWLREVDPLPHSWDVTSDSISAWFASELGAASLVLVKPPGANVGDAVDAYFTRAVRPTLTWSIVAPAPGKAAEPAMPKPDAERITAR